MAYHVRRSAPCAERDRSLHQQRLRPGHRRRVVSAAAQTDTEDRDMVSGRGNAAAVETTERFPPRLGSRWRTRGSHIPTADHHHRNEERTEDWTAPTRSGTLTARQTNGNSGGKALKIRGPFLLKTDSPSTIHGHAESRDLGFHSACESTRIPSRRTSPSCSSR